VGSLRQLSQELYYMGVTTRYKKVDQANAEAYRLRVVDPDQSLKLASEAHKESVAKGYLKGQADSLRTLATLKSHSDWGEAYKLAQRALKIYHEVGDEYGESSALMTVSLYYQQRGEFETAHRQLQEAYGKAVGSGNWYVASIAVFNLGTNAVEREDYEAAIEYFYHARTAAERGHNEPIKWASIVATAKAQYEIGEAIASTDEIEEAFEKAKASGGYHNAADICLLLARLYFERDEWKKTTFCIRTGLVLSRLADKPYLTWALKDLRGQLLLSKNRLFSADRALRAALLIAQRSGYKSGEMRTLKTLSKAIRRRDVANLAYDYLDRHLQIRQQIFDSESEKRLREVQTIHQVDLVEAESEFLKNKNIELAAINDRLERALQEREELQKELERIAAIDELTGVLNRRRILAIGAGLVTRFHSHRRPGVVMIVDIDHFKSVNDTHGHSVGDEVLRRFAQSCQRVLRPTDSFGRLGGEEFCILLDNTTSAIAEKVAERILQSIRSTRVEDLMPGRKITASLGMTAILKTHSTIELALHHADMGLYEAKNGGRDCFRTGKSNTKHVA
jgi:diguanylate cyclase (GGDEF)-like protein